MFHLCMCVVWEGVVPRVCGLNHGVIGYLYVWEDVQHLMP